MRAILIHRNGSQLRSEICRGTHRQSLGPGEQRMPLRRLLLAVLLLAACGALGFAEPNPPTAAVAVEAPLRYRFSVGEELIYREVGHSVPQPGDRPDAAVGRR